MVDTKSTASFFLKSLLSSPSENSAIEFFVDEVNEKVDIDFGTTEHLHDGQSFILQLQQILKKKDD